MSIRDALSTPSPDYFLLTFTNKMTHLLVLVIQGFKVTIRCSREIHLLMPRPHSNKIINDLAREEVQLAAYSRQ